MLAATKLQGQPDMVDGLTEQKLRLFRGTGFQPTMKAGNKANNAESRRGLEILRGDEATAACSIGQQGEQPSEYRANGARQSKALYPPRPGWAQRNVGHGNQFSIRLLYEPQTGGLLEPMKIACVNLPRGIGLILQVPQPDLRLTLRCDQLAQTVESVAHCLFPAARGLDR